MKHSILMIVGSNLIYQYAPENRPIASGVDGVREYAIWQQSAKSFIIKDSDRADFDNYFQDSTATEASIPYEVMEIYTDIRAGKNYARMNKNVKVDVVTKKVVGLIKVCKVCEVSSEIPLSEVEHYFPICKSCLSELKDVISQRKNTIIATAI